MTCLSSAQIQAVADGEGTPAECAHAAACAACARQLAHREAQCEALRGAVNAVAMPGPAVQRVHAALAGAGSATGATRLRSSSASSHWHRAAWGTAAVAAATLVAVLFVAPMVKQDEGTVSASEVLAQSANRLARPVLSGVETLEYELVLDGVPKEMMPDHANGVYRVRQSIDHTNGGRFRFASYGPDGAAISSIAQDPATGRRVMGVNAEGQWFRFEVSVPGAQGPSLPELERLHMEATIGMMQASGKHLLEVVDSPDGQQYRIEVPKVSAPLNSPVWDLAEARVVIDASDYRVRELAVRGTFLKQAYTVSYRLISRQVAANVAPDTFEVPRQEGEIVIAGAGSALPSRDAMVLALRELAKMKRAR